ncbi:hypothetical protein HYU06_00690 [Candidatus Woesearchaeota archaeon]|nr:hypothetical protein [Candidatus Woesearchaeota archaeon]
MKEILGYKCTHNLGTNVTMNIDNHLERLKESIEAFDEAIIKDIVKKQRNIGFNASAAAADMFEIFLHKNNLIDPGFVVKHEWFKSKNKVKDKFPYEFEKKEEILDLMHRVEERRDSLCYGKPQSEKVVEDFILKFQELKKLFKSIGVEIE